MVDSRDSGRDAGGLETAQEDLHARMAGRRRMLKMGVGVAPIALTFASRSVSACTITTASAVASQSGSRVGTGSTGTSSGYSPATWCNTPLSSWPSSCKETVGTSVYSAKCSAVLGAGCLSGVSGFDPNSNTTISCNDETRLRQLMRLTGSSTALTLAQHCAAAYVNAAANRYSGLITTTQVRYMHMNTRNGGFYEPTAGIKWYANSTSPTWACPPGKSPGVIGYCASTFAT